MWDEQTMEKKGKTIFVCVFLFERSYEDVRKKGETFSRERFCLRIASAHGKLAAAAAWRAME